jgi:hypothetical protein
LIALYFSCGSAQVRAAEEAAERPARAAQCFLEVNGVHYVGGDCLFTPLDKIGSFRIVGNGLSKDLSAQVKVKAAPEGEGYASWSGPQGGDATAIPLGDTYNDQRGCWNNYDPPTQPSLHRFNERVRRRSWLQDAQAPHLSRPLLRARGERPRSCAAEHSDEVPSPHG